MVKITLIEPDGAARTFDAKPGQTLMEAATKNGVEGIIGECGGNCVCGTCRFYPAPEWQERLGAVSAIEQDLLEFTEDPQPGVRLSCRITITEELEGMVANLPARTGSGNTSDDISI